MNRFALGTAALLLGLPAAASAQVDRLEHDEGATWLAGMLGDGGLSVGVGMAGEVTDLLWPGPPSSSLVQFATEASPQARTRDRFGAAPTDGLFLGVWIELEGSDPEFSWLYDGAWTHSQRYDDGVYVHVAARDALGLRVVQSMAVSEDALAWRATVERAPGFGVGDVHVVMYGDPASRDGECLGYLDPSAETYVHGCVDGEGAAFRALSSEDWQPTTWRDDGLGRAQDLLAPRGSFFAVGADGLAGGHVGSYDDCDGVSVASAFDQAQDSLSAATGTASYAWDCETDFSTTWTVEFKEDQDVDRGAVDFFVAAGGTLRDTHSALDGARAAGFDVIAQRASDAAQAAADGLVLPTGIAGTPDADVAGFAEGWARDVAVVRSADGALAASVASQPRFHVDRPWESAWTELALEIAGDFAGVSEHHQHLMGRQTQQATAEPFLPAGTWPTDRGAVDIPQLGLTTWSFWRHAQYAGNDVARRTTLASTWPSIARAADLLAACVVDDHPALDGDPAEGEPAWTPLLAAVQGGTFDAAAGLGAAANGDWESLRPCASAQGGLPLDDAGLLATNLARIGLRAAVAAADALCVDEARVASWEARANELAALMLAADYDGTTWTGDGALVAWPWVPEIAPAWWFAFTANPDPEAQETEVAEYVATALDAWVDQELARAVAAIQLDTDGRGDEAIALLEAELWGADHGLGRLQRSEARAVLRRLVVDLPSEAGHLGGAFVAIGDDKAEQRVGQPHVPAESRAVTALLAFSHADRFVAAGATSLALECPTGEEPELQRTAASCTDDCQSSVAGRSSTPSLALVLGALVLLARRRRP